MWNSKLANMTIYEIEQAWKQRVLTQEDVLDYIIRWNAPANAAWEATIETDHIRIEEKRKEKGG